VGSTQPFCRYTAVSAIARTDLPAKIYFFPPLLCDSKGTPQQVLKPKLGPDGALVGWASSSALSREIESTLKLRAAESGFEVVSFEDVLAAKQPHSILIVSSFYSASINVESPKEGQLDHYILTMMKASTFDLSLDPSRSRMIGKSDGLSFFLSQDPISRLEAKSLSSLIPTLGDNVSGYTNL
jgi:hypothetical protein